MNKKKIYMYMNYKVTKITFFFRKNLKPERRDIFKNKFFWLS